MACFPGIASWFDPQRSQSCPCESFRQPKVVVSTLRRGQSAGLSGYPTSEGDYRLSNCCLILPLQGFPNRRNYFKWNFLAAGQPCAPAPAHALRAAPAVHAHPSITHTRFSPPDGVEPLGQQKRVSVVRGGQGRGRTHRDDHPGPRSGNRECLSALSSAGATTPRSSEPGNRLDECGRHRPVPAEALASLGWKEAERVQRFQRTGSPAQIHVGDLQIARRGFEVRVAEQNLNRSEINAGFEQMRGEGVPQQVLMNRLRDAGGAGRVPARKPLQGIAIPLRLSGRSLGYRVLTAPCE
jgi:hypothetical protein